VGVDEGVLVIVGVKLDDGVIDGVTGGTLGAGTSINGILTSPSTIFTLKGYISSRHVLVGILRLESTGGHIKTFLSKLP
jgi:hypothetical protein